MHSVKCRIQCLWYWCTNVLYSYKYKNKIRGLFSNRHRHFLNFQNREKFLNIYWSHTTYYTSKTLY